MMSPFVPRSLTGALLIATWSLVAIAAETERVAVHSGASEDYTARKFTKEGPQIETYVFAEGKFFGGEGRDTTMRATTFTDIANVLAHDLANQEYLPAPNQETADLLIIVHWGTTLPGAIDPFLEYQLNDLTNEFFEEQAASEGLPDLGKLSEIETLNRTYQMSVEQAIAESSKLLGYQEALAKERHRVTVSGMTEAENTLRAELLEERYFIIMMAWENQGLLRKEAPKLLWSTRFSMRAPGKNFTIALPALSRVASNYFGRKTNGIVRGRTHLGKGNVEYGELEILGTEPTEPRPSK